MMVVSPVTIPHMARLMVAGATSRRSNATPMAIATGLLLAYNISKEPPTLLVAVFVVMEAVFTAGMVALTVRAEFNTDFVIALELPIHFVRFSTMVVVLGLRHNSLESDESTLSGDKQLDRRAAVLARAVLETEGAAGV